MAHFDYLKPGGVWGLLSLLTSGIMEAIDARLYKCINGDEGGTWAPHLPGSMVPTPITIGGDGLRVLGPFFANDAWINIPSGKYLSVASGGTVTFGVGSTFNLWGTTAMTGTFTVSNTGKIRIANIGGIEILNAASMWVDSGGLIDVKAGGLFEIRSGGAWQLDAGAIALVADGAAFYIAADTGHGGGSFIVNGKLQLYGAGTTYPGSTLTLSGPVVFNATGGSPDVFVASGTQWTFGGASPTLAVKYIWTPAWQGGPLRTNPAATALTDAALRVTAGQIRLEMGILSPLADPGADAIVTAGNVVKSRGTVQTDGVGGSVLIGGFNVASASITGGGTSMHVTFARAMPDISYSVIASGVVAGSVFPCAMVLGKATNGFSIIAWDVQGGGLINFGSSVQTLHFEVT